MKCIKCKGQLVETKGSYSFRWCTLCKGLWLGKNAIYTVFKNDQTVKDVLAHPLDQSKTINAKCPSCHQKLQNGKLAGTKIIVEQCVPCEHYFFDDREINALLEFVNHAQMPRGRDIDWSQKKLKQSDIHCPVCKTEPLFGIEGEMDKVEVCLKCNGVATKVELMQKMVGRSLFGGRMFEFRAGGEIIAHCRFCHNSQETQHATCLKCHRPIERLNCFSCQSRMSEYQLNDVVIDRCQICNGLWLDGGEFEKVMTINPDIKRQIEREFLHRKLNQVKTESVSAVYEHSIELTRRDMILDFWGPLGALIFF